jgi:hypothetical protein
MITSRARFDTFERDFLEIRHDLSRKKRNEELGRKNGTDSAFTRALQVFRLDNLLPHYKRNGSIFDPSEEWRDIDWSRLPWAVSVDGGHIPRSRRWRKIVQVECMLAPTLHLLMLLLEKAKQHANAAGKKIRVVEFCGGSGFVLLPLAAYVAERRPDLLPFVEFVLIDFKPKSIEIAEERLQAAESLWPDQVRLILGRVEDFHERFDIGIALHACGSMTDVSIAKCIASRAALVVCSCCVGKISKTRHLPLSQRFVLCLGCDAIEKPTDRHPISDIRSSENAQVFWPKSATAFMALVKAADFGHAALSLTHTAKNKLRRLSKAYVEEDRRLWLEESGYCSGLHLMRNVAASPKNDILVAFPSENVAYLGLKLNSASVSQEVLIDELLGAEID